MKILSKLSNKNIEKRGEKDNLDFYILLNKYKSEARDEVHNFRELRELFSYFKAFDEVTGEKKVLTVHLILQANSHNFSSCHYKAFECSNELRNRIQVLCKELLNRLDTILRDYLTLEIKNFGIKYNNTEKHEFIEKVSQVGWATLFCPP